MQMPGEETGLNDQSGKLKDTKEDWFRERVVETEEVGWDWVTKGLADFCKCIPYPKTWEAIQEIASESRSQNMKLDSCFTPFIKINSRWICRSKYIVDILYI